MLDDINAYDESRLGKMTSNVMWEATQRAQDERRLDDARNELDALHIAASRCLDDIRSRLFELKCEIDARDSDVAYAMERYATDMMNDFIFDREAEITNEITDLEDRLGDDA